LPALRRVAVSIPVPDGEFRITIAAPTHSFTFFGWRMAGEDDWHPAGVPPVLLPS
jgi:hypothetical protein